MNILLIGNFGAGNYGDEAILIAFLQKAIKAFPKAGFSIVTANRETSLQFLEPFFDKIELAKLEFVHPIPFGFRSGFRVLKQGKKWLEQYKKVDLGIYCGGGLFTDEESFKSIPLWANYAILLNFLKKPIYAFGVGIGPIRNPVLRKLMKWIIEKMKFLGVRDSKSIEAIKNMNGQNQSVYLTGDTVLLLEIHKEKYTAHFKKPYITLSLRPWKNMDAGLYKKIAQTLDAVVKKFGLNIVLIPFQKSPQNDDVLLNKIFEQSSSKEHIFYMPWGADLKSVFSVLQEAEFHVGMRLHSNLFSLLLETPFLSIPYAQKSVTFLEDSRIADWVISFDNLLIPEKAIPLLEAFIAKKGQNQVKIGQILRDSRVGTDQAFQELTKFISKSVDRM